MTSPKLPIPTEGLADFCRRWKIVELSLFGSVLRGDFGPESDVDVLVTFMPGAGWSMLDVAAAKLELEALFGHPVDLIERPALEKHHNPWLKQEVLGTAHLVYAA